MKKLLLTTLSLVLLSSISFAKATTTASDEDKATAFAKEMEKWAVKADKAYAGKENVVREVVYKNYKGKELGFDIIQPTKQLYKDGSPVIISIHGGGWGGGTRYVVSEEDMKRYGDLGIAVVPISYSKETIQECVTDCFDAARFLALNAKKYNLDMNRVGISGHSAGGHLCLMLTLAPDDVFAGDEALKGAKYKILCGSAKAPICTLIDDYIFEKYKQPYNRANSPRNMGDRFDKTFDLRKKLSPSEYITTTSPKLQIIHGDADTTCPIEETTRTCERAKSIGNEIELHVVPGAGHGVTKSRNDEEEAFYSKHLLKDIKKL
ncbi:MAG: prolyl oligopeptidase family serine peptidase [Opitutales bacterium]